jgi:DNA gyrase inhibitor GyrI
MQINFPACCQAPGMLVTAALRGAALVHVYARRFKMDTVDIRILRLPRLRVASALGFGSQPEIIAWEKILAFVAAKNLMQAAPPPRFFGFNNPDPSAGSPNYGYEQWVTIGAEVQAEDEITLKDFPGGLYAVLCCPGIPNPDIWRKLIVWRETSPYRMGNHQWLEELLSPPGSGEFLFDLYLPVAESGLS